MPGVKTIAYAGPSRDVVAGGLRHVVDAHPRGPIEALDAAAVPGALARADSVVFVADAADLPATQAAWRRLFEQLSGAGRPGNLPVVVLLAGANDAEAAARLEETLGIQAVMVQGTLRLPNPYALRFPARFSDATEAFEAAVAAAFAGPFPIPENAGQLAMAMLDRQLAERLAKLAPGPDAMKQAKQVVKGDPRAREQLLESAKDSFLEQILRDPEVMARVRAKAERQVRCSVRLDEPLACAGCARSRELVELPWSAGTGPYTLGDDVGLRLEALDARHTWLLRQPGPEEPVIALAVEPCRACKTLGWCAVTVAHGRLASVWPAAFTRATLERAHLADAGGLQHEAARLAGKPVAELTSRDAILETLAARL